MKKSKTPRSVNKNKLNTKLNIVSIVLAVVVAFFAGFFVNRLYEANQKSRATSIASEFIGHLLEGNSDQAYEISGEGIKESQTSDEFIAAMGSLEANDPQLLDPTVLISEDRVMYIQYIEGLPETSDGRTAGEFYVTLTKEGRHWRVQSANVQ
jgi:hypothetical protein